MKIGEVIQKLIKEDGGVTIYNANQNMMQLSREMSKKRPAYAKIAINDSDAEKLLRTIQPNGAQAFLIVADIAVVNRLFDEEKRAKEVADNG